MCLAGWSHKLRGVCSNDEGRNRLEKSVETIFKGKIQQSEPEVNEGRIIAGSRLRMKLFFYECFFPDRNMAFDKYR